MIAFIHGVVEEKHPTRVIINAGGVGYELAITLNTYEDLPPTGQVTRLHTHHHVRDDAEVLYGFSNTAERAFFEQLIGVASIGPSTAIGILSGMPLVGLRAAIVAEDVKRLSSIKGVGKKTAERMIVELKDKISALAVAEEQAQGNATTAATRVISDAVLALVALGYRNAEAFAAVKQAVAGVTPPAAVEDVVRKALAVLQNG